MRNEKQVLWHLFGGLEMLFKMNRAPGDPTDATCAKLLNRLCDMVNAGRAPGIVVRALANQRETAAGIGDAVECAVWDYRLTDKLDNYDGPNAKE